MNKSKKKQRKENMNIRNYKFRVLEGMTQLKLIIDIQKRIPILYGMLFYPWV